MTMAVSALINIRVQDVNNHCAKEKVQDFIHERVSK